ncbi:DUF2461 domain-containing protein [candidate division WOR-3 bacterium]|nr:DUF2461 domain-containing protein [candidate division WOR-3 bacterium]
MDEFQGFPDKGLAFLRDLTANNNKTWFEENREVYKSQLVTPALAFISEFGQLLQKRVSADIVYDTRTNGAGSLFRIYRDVRFSPDKSPYKTHLGIFFWEGPGKKMDNPGYYFHLEPGGALMYAGKYQFSPDQLAVFRDAVADKEKGTELERAIDAVKKAGYAVGDIHYKKVPRGYDPAHPRSELLRHNTLYARSPVIPAKVVSSSRLLDICLEHCKRLSPLQGWLLKLRT